MNRIEIEQLETRTPSGKAIILTANEYLDRLSISVEVPAAKITGRLSVYASGFLRPLEVPRDGATHAFAIVTKAEVGVATVEAERILDWIGRAESVVAAMPRVQAAKLREQRRTLAAAVAGALDDETERRAGAWEREDEAAAVTWRDHKIQEARAALIAFDAEHPEVSEAIKLERSAGVDRLIEAGI